MKYEWKKNDKTLYMPKNAPTVIDVPAMNYFTLHGSGNPNHAAFEEAVGVLYSLSYAIRMMPKKGVTPEGYYEYTVFPLEGVWDLEEEARGAAVLDKDKLVYTLMIRQPEFVTEAFAQEVIETVSQKKPHPLLSKVRFETIEEGMCVQMMHHGPYDDEPASFARMEQYCEEHGLIRVSKLHKEIYISDVRKTQPDKLKTALRFKVRNV
ncbi:GyrI-like domain-containing protein [Paenibacillus glycanilyticus]|uniref:GyrI-like small molecule binding domain-containing protein n=1 Tax=Paenibacillus glycanilyticus TaxID=126569 RepID=A0ABQ6GK45_9BACL|nr:GyrI-like domain-containing protein [Paenibacillus glycanilyticus]GLX70875.1 hypothetical protein MU1_52220 [Paenibacillus glycanilyticus]